jgi:hypothetical protein
VALWRLAQRNWGPDWRVWRAAIARITSPYGAHHQSSYILDMGPVASPSGLSISIQAPPTSCAIVCYRLFFSGGCALGPVFFPKLSAVPVHGWLRHHPLKVFFFHLLSFDNFLESSYCCHFTLKTKKSLLPQEPVPAATLS